MDDGFGNVWEKCERHDCGLHIVRPGKVQCCVCSDERGDMGVRVEKAVSWEPIDTAPKDGHHTWLLSKGDEFDVCGEHIVRPPRPYIGQWDSEGDSWVDEHGDINGEADHLEVTGTWLVGGGWLQPNEVTHWAPT